MNFIRKFSLIQKRSFCHLADDVAFLQASYSARYKKHRSWDKATYGGRHLVTLIPGNGIGPEMFNYIQSILNQMNCPIDFEIVDVKESPYDVKYAITTIKRNKCCLKGSIEKFKDTTLYGSPNVAIRKKLDLFCNLNVCKALQGIQIRYPKLDIVIIRENIEGEYSMMEHSLRSGLVESLKLCTEKNTRRLANWAFQYAKKNKRKKITIIHKANIMKISDGLFMHVIKEVAKDFPEIAVNDMIVDNVCMQIVSNPYQFDVMICPNLYGSILCNIICGLLGGAGLISASNFGYDYAAFETATRSAGTSLQGKNLANPICFLNAAIDLMHYVGLPCHADLLTDAIVKTVEVDGIKTQDIGGNSTTSEVIQRIRDNLNIFMSTAQD